MASATVRRTCSGWAAQWEAAFVRHTSLVSIPTTVTGAPAASSGGAGDRRLGDGAARDDEQHRAGDPGGGLRGHRRVAHRWAPGIQSVPASGTLAMAAASMVSAARSSGSRLCTSDLPQARASMVTSMVSARR